jgi:3-hydroxyacyl-[acyl-carrier-protein] dehydratase
MSHQGSAGRLAGALSILPHRPPFVLLDRLLELVPGERGRAVKQVTGGEPWVAGGSALPGGLIVEACAQLLAVVAGSGGPPGAGGGRPGYLVALEGFTFGRPVTAGECLVVEAVLGRRLGPLLSATVRAEVDGETLAEGRITVSSPA